MNDDVTFICNEKKSDEICCRFRAFRHYLLNKTDLEFNCFYHRIDNISNTIANSSLDKNPLKDEKYLQINAKIAEYNYSLKNRQNYGKKKNTRPQENHEYKRPGRQNLKQEPKTNFQQIPNQRKGAHTEKPNFTRKPPMMNLTKQKQIDNEDDLLDIPL